MENSLPAIPPKRYFTIGEVSELCGVKPYVLRYWEQEFTQLRPMKRRGNRRYYQHHEVLLIRRIRDLLYDQGFTISGARNRLIELGGSFDAFDLAEHEAEADALSIASPPDQPQATRSAFVGLSATSQRDSRPNPTPWFTPNVTQPQASEPLSVRDELLSIRTLLEIDF
ncbi:MAG: MerR family transcriptional regulator [Leptothrix sp. (in: b-proteobacteria)]